MSLLVVTQIISKSFNLWAQKRAECHVTNHVSPFLLQKMTINNHSLFILNVFLVIFHSGILSYHDMRSVGVYHRLMERSVDAKSLTYTVGLVMFRSTKLKKKKKNHKRMCRELQSIRLM